MDIKKILLISLITITILSSFSMISAKNIEDIGFNVSSELKQVDGFGLEFEDGEGNHFRIFEHAVEDVNSSEYSIKYNETVFMINSSMGGDSINDANGNDG